MTDKDFVDDPCADPNGDCAKAISMVNLYLDNVLEVNDQSFLSNHIDDCPDCKHGFEFESAFHGRMKTINPIPMPEIVKNNIMLALGFPGMSDPMKGAFSALGAPDVALDESFQAKFGIPRGDIPRGEIPSTQEIRKDLDSSSQPDTSSD
jgi:hypothetical protein